MELGEQGGQLDLLNNLLKEDSASPATVLVTGRANVLEYVPTATGGDINQNGVVNLPEQDAGGGAEVTSSDSESESPTRADAVDPVLANRANRISFTANMAQ